MNRAPELDFALDRAQRRRWRHVAFAAIGLLLGLQIGISAWRFQSLQANRVLLEMQYRQLTNKTGRAAKTSLSPENAKVSVAVQLMLDSLAVPWDELLSAIEVSRTKAILVDAIQPKAEDGSVNISIISPGFSEIAEFIRQLAQHDQLQDVMLVSESLPDNSAGSIRAVINARWQKAK